MQTYFRLFCSFNTETTSFIAILYLSGPTLPKNVQEKEVKLLISYLKNKWGRERFLLRSFAYFALNYWKVSWAYIQFLRQQAAA